MISLYITFKNRKEAEKTAGILLEKRLIACANIFPVKSIFRWKRRIKRQPETAMLAKSTEENFAMIQKEVKKIHSYDVPCIVMLNAESNEEFSKWVERETGKKE